jgi:hypothetical protein
MGRKRKSACGATGMLGKMGEVKQWKKNEKKFSSTGNYGRLSVKSL